MMTTNKTQLSSSKDWMKTQQKSDAGFAMNKFVLKGKLAVLASLAITLVPFSPLAQAKTDCDRACMSHIVDQLLESMVEHDPQTLPLAPVYKATENGHPAALGMMTLWRTVTEAGKPDLLAIDSTDGQAYLGMVISEGGSDSILWGRIKVEDQKISELELYTNRSRGDHGFSFSAYQLPGNYERWMSPPANRKKASRKELLDLANASFDTGYDFDIAIDPDCQFTEVGWSVIDPGLGDETPEGAPAPPGAPAEEAAPGDGGFSTNEPLGCQMPPGRPTDPRARNLVIDEELGIVVVGAVVPGYVYPYPYFGHQLSAFIPTEMSAPIEVQKLWFDMKVNEGKSSVLAPSPATGEVLQVLQYYNGKLQGEQINVYVGRPGTETVWLN